ncbi:MAG: hypothetical protein V1862_07195 [Methanobacteriota archaeon]
MSYHGICLHQISTFAYQHMYLCYIESDLNAILNPPFRANHPDYGEKDVSFIHQNTYYSLSIIITTDIDERKMDIVRYDHP